jgi:radical SAM superfamily enzyme YgiQ (UPF0313 family)
MSTNQETDALNVVLISTYELGRQPFGLASPAAWLRKNGATVTCLDLAVQPLDEQVVQTADLVAFYLPMHTATRLATRAIQRVRALNPSARLCAYGLYAPMNVEFLRAVGVEFIVGGEIEERLTDLMATLKRRDSGFAHASSVDHSAGVAPVPPVGPGDDPTRFVALDRLRFVVPDRSDLPALSSYAKLRLPDGSLRLVGYTEASRGCKHLCRHCPVVPIYRGHFRIVQHDIVLEDIARQVGAGAEHVTFGDPDFFNGPTHAIRLVRALHRRFPGLTYDVTIKVEHLLRHAEHVPVLRDTGCALVTTAVESIDDRVLALLDKGHTRDDFFRVVALCRAVGVALNPTFVTFTPWTTLHDYCELLATLDRLDLVGNVAPIQLAIRLLIPMGSRLLELPEVRRIICPYDERALMYPWVHPDSRVDALQQVVEALIPTKADDKTDREQIFASVWLAAHHALGVTPPVRPAATRQPVTIPYLTEPWYC